MCTHQQDKHIIRLKENLVCMWLDSVFSFSELLRVEDYSSTFHTAVVFCVRMREQILAYLADHQCWSGSTYWETHK